MLPLTYRLPLRQSKEFFLRSTRFSTKLFVVYAGKVTNVPQLAVIVPKKKIAKASHRNLLKRRIHEALYQLRQELPKKELVFYYKVPFEAGYQEVEQDLKLVTSN